VRHLAVAGADGLVGDSFGSITISKETRSLPRLGAALSEAGVCGAIRLGVSFGGIRAPL
jgi:hypothetical protein